MRRGVSLSVLLGLLIAGLASAQGSSTPQITFEASAVVASGLTPGKPVAWFGVEHSIDAEFSGEIWPHDTWARRRRTARRVWIWTTL
jgi:hypothetical protein